MSNSTSANASMSVPSAAATVQVKKLVLSSGPGAGRPAVIVPIVAKESESIRTAAAEAAAPEHVGLVDLVEWRIDHFAGLTDTETVLRELTVLQDILGDLPLLATVRTDAEGGAAAVSDRDYLDLVRSLCASGHVDLVDIEYQRASADECIAAAHDHGVTVVASNHDFHATPDADEIVHRLATMESMGADIPKIAVMPQSPQDVLTLLQATLQAAQELDSPIITMSMQGMGLASRVSGGVFGSCATFATLGEASAPGQIPAETVSSVLRAIHG
ncbi:type I 3-dehydroquinate dehydratase [Citricoccus sp. GCM10030269]|uniref:type I 3-dehydroquinate dehydratase n=1 Tax=Citricoccus sp. GCM10030269 TaxID=3273388 RepID=UPI003614B3F5